jgi:hypothetical protein
MPRNVSGAEGGAAGCWVRVFSVAVPVELILFALNCLGRPLLQSGVRCISAVNSDNQNAAKRVVGLHQIGTKCFLRKEHTWPAFSLLLGDTEVRVTFAVAATLRAEWT